MAGYTVYTGGNGIAIKPNLYEVRIVSISIFNKSTIDPWIYLVRHTGATMTGGTVSTVYALRDGTPPASTTAREAATTFSGVEEILGSLKLGSASSSLQDHTTSPSSVNPTTPMPLTITPGKVFELQFSENLNNNAVIQIYFEELRLQGSY